MTDKEFTLEVMRGLKTIMKACVRRFGLSYTDFLPKEENAIITAMASNQTATPKPVFYGTVANDG